MQPHYLIPVFCKVDAFFHRINFTIYLAFVIFASVVVLVPFVFAVVKFISCLLIEANRSEGMKAFLGSLKCTLFIVVRCTLFICSYRFNGLAGVLIDFLYANKYIMIVVEGLSM